MENTKRPDIETLRRKLSAVKGKTYWRGIEEIAETEEFKQWLDDEFPYRSSIPDLDRRSFMKFMGASLALAGLAGCRNLPQEKIVPYVKAPVERYPGQLLSYATASNFNGYGFGVLVSSNEGRPTKIDGNPDHPASLGSSDVFTQAEILQMYDPDRLQVPTMGENPSTWDEVTSALRGAATAGKVRVLTETVASPTLYAQIQTFLKKFPGSRWHQYSPVNRDNDRQASALAFGRVVDTHYNFMPAAVVLSLDGDFLGCTPRHVRHTRDFMAGRNPEAGTINRLYVAETSFTTTGSFADHRIAMKPSEMEDFVRYLGAAVGVEGGPGKLPKGVTPAWVNALVTDLLAHRGSSLVYPGDQLSPVALAIVHGINQALGNVGKTVTYTAPVEPSPVVHADELAALVADINANRVDTLIIFGGNPVYSAPADFKLGPAIQRVKNSFRLGHYEDETSAVCKWVLPESHFLESWGDIRSYDGTASIVQPLIQPLFDSRSAIELFAILNEDTRTDYDIVRGTWSGSPTNMNEAAWRAALNNGVIPNTSAPATSVTAKPGFSATRGIPHSGTYEAVFAPDPTLYDGRYANNGWLQELPKPLTKLSWDNAAIVSPATAVALGVLFQDNVEISANGNRIEAPIYVLPGHPDGVVTLHLGSGRSAVGKVGEGAGFNFQGLRSSKSPWSTSVEIKKTGRTTALATSQTHHSMEGRDIVREGDMEEYKKNPLLREEDKAEERGKDAILYDLSADWAKENPDLSQWAMVIDTTTCTGCNSCVIACQAENNIPTVGKDQVQRGRLMHWIRVDRYFRVEDNSAERDFREPISEVEAIDPGYDKGAMNPLRVKTVCMPVPCMHCETAPCEPVCPVAATVHSHEGLNQMVYNRCVGTRYCSNNCPYKVRRFNFYNYQFRYKNFSDEKDIPLLKMLNNPDVTVRGRGVMEKCTYCVQRINRARITAKKEERRIRDGEVIPACAQACPSKSIVFGDMTDPRSALMKQKANPRNYSLLGDLNTRPRTTYLGKVRNVNHDIKDTPA